MNDSTEKRYLERLNRVVTALRNEKPDCVPIRPFAAEFVARHSGYTCQDVAHDFTKAFDATCKTLNDYDWDAAPGSMVYVWTGLTQALGLKYYGIPGIDIPADTGFQYIEPAPEDAFMKADEYDALIDDPTAFLYERWLPRASRYIQPTGSTLRYENNLALVKGAMAMMHYFNAFPAQGARMRQECGTPGAISGIFKAPFDIIGDKLRGYIGLTMDMITQPEKVLAACEALMPHLYQMGMSGADPEGYAPIGFWMHRGCVPFVTPDQFDSHYWPTLKPIIEEFWAHGHQTLFYAEGNWDHHLESFAELPEKSMVFHIDRSDIEKATKILGPKFCLSGGVPNTVLSYGTQEEVEEACKVVLDTAAQDGGFIMDASAIIQNDAKPENMRILTDFTRKYGQYDGEPVAELPPRVCDGPIKSGPPTAFTPDPRAGVCSPWEAYSAEKGSLPGDADLAQRIWQEVDGLGYLFIWHCLLSF
ncbi:MAG: uroporphyrinogen decarboxylase family protein [Candidatus Hydrogenedentales bacterium]